MKNEYGQTAVRGVGGFRQEDQLVCRSTEDSEKLFWEKQPTNYSNYSSAEI